MSAPTDPDDLLALTTLLTNPQGPGWPGEVFQRVAVRQAHRILGSEWLAERDAQQRSEGASEAWEIAAQRRNEARRFYVAWQSARMRAAALLRGEGA